MTQGDKTSDSFEFDPNFFREIQRIGQFGYWSWRMDTSELVWSEEMYRIFGRDPNDGPVYMEEFSKQVHPNDLDFLRARLKESETTGIFKARYRVRRFSDGVERIIDTRGKVSFNDDGVPREHIGIIQDITDLQQIDNTLRPGDVGSRLLFDHSGLGMGYYDTEGVCLFMNRTACDLLRQKPDEITGRHIRDIFDERTSESILNRFPQVQDTDEPAEFVDKVPLPSGEKWFRSVYSRDTDETGRVTGIQIISSEITEQVQRDDALARSEQRFRTITENSADAIMIAGPDGRFSYVNRAAAELLGYTVEELQNLSISSVSGEDTTQQMHELMATGKLFVETYGRRKDGSKVPIDLNAVVLPTGEFYSSIRDVTARKTAEARVVEQSQLLTGLLSQSGLMVFTVDVSESGEYTYSYFCDMFEKLTGIPSSDLPRLATVNIEQVLDRNVYATLFKNYEHCVKTGQSYTFEQRIPFKDQDMWWYTSLMPFKNESGRVFRIVGNTFDITTQKQAQEALVQSKANLRALIENTDDVVVSRDLQGKAIVYNQAFAKTVKVLFDADAHVGIRSMDYLSTEDQNHWAEVFARVHEGETYIEEFCWDVNGETRYYELSLHPIHSGGKIIGSTEFTRDITERKRIEEQLRRNQSELEYISVNSPGVVYQYQMDAEGNPSFTYLSSNVFRIYGYTAEELKSNASLLQSLIAPEDMPHFVAAVEESRENLTEFRCKFRARRKDGAIRWISSRANPKRLDDGSVLWTGVSLDVTDGVESERKLAESNERISAAMQLGNLAWWELELPDRIFHLPPEQGAALGINSVPLDGRSMDDMLEMLKPEHADQIRTSIGDLIDGKVDTYVTDFLFQHPEGGDIWLHSVGGIAEWHEDGSPKRLVGVSVDITDLKNAEMALRESEQKFRSTFENSAIAIAMVDRNGSYISVNQAYCDLLGYSREYLLKTDYISVTHPDDLDKSIEAYQKLVRDAKPYELEKRYVTKSGDVKHVVTSVSAVSSSDGRVMYTIAHMLDTTERRQAEDALKRSAIMSDSSLDAIIATDTEGLITYWNNGAARVYGYTAEEVLGKYIGLIYFEKDMAMLRSLVEALNNGREINNFEMTCRNRKGQQVHALISLTSLRDADGNITELLSFAKDITDRRRVEDALRAAKEYTENLIETANVMVVGLDDQGNITIFNKAAEEITGYSREELKRRNWFETLVPRTRYPEVWDVHNSAFGDANEMVRTFRNPILTKSGEERLIEWQNNVIREGGKRVGTISFGMDITEREHAQQESMRLQEQLQQSQKIESIGRLAGGVAHDFNNMLSTITGFTEIAMSSMNEDDPKYGDLQEVLAASKRSADIVRQLLAFARKQTIEPKVLDLNATIESMLNMLRRLIGEDIKLNWHPSADLHAVKLDPSQVDQIVANLCVNARDAIGGNGNISIRTENVTLKSDRGELLSDLPSGDYVVLSITDDGVGMDDETMQQVFEPFFTTKASGLGTGLGLSTVYGIVRQNDGTVDVTSAPNQGTTFTIYFPSCHEAAGPEVTRESSGTTHGEGETILVVEDESSVLKVLCRILEKSGYRVLTADSPGRAIELAADESLELDMLISDVVMPEMSGKAMVDEIMTYRPDILALYMSGYTSNAIAHHGVLDEGIDFIQKPFTHEDLSQKVREVLNKKTANRSE